MAEQKLGHVAMTLELTPTEKRLYALLESGEHCVDADLIAVIDSLAKLNDLRYHMCNMRTKLRASGVNGTVVREGDGYRLVAYVASSDANKI